MKNETIPILEKTRPSARTNVQAPIASACCGGPPTLDDDACCRFDEDIKALGQRGCGCNSGSTNTKGKSSCC